MVLACALPVSQYNGDVAQLGRARRFNRWVRGSNPLISIIFNHTDRARNGSVFFCGAPMGLMTRAPEIGSLPLGNRVVSTTSFGKQKRLDNSYLLNIIALL